MRRGFLSWKAAVTAIMAASMGLSGCGFLYMDSRPAAYEPRTEPAQSLGAYSLGVLQVADARPSDKGGFPLLCDFAAPFVSWSTGYSDRPDESPIIGSPMIGPIANIVWGDLSVQLRHDHLVDKTYPVVERAGQYLPVLLKPVVAATSSPDVKAHTIAPVMLAGSERPQLVLKPTLTESRWSTTIYCFIPFVGALLFPIFGVPFQSDTYKLGLKLELYDASAPASPLWSYAIDETSKGYVNIYWYVSGPDQDTTAERTPQIEHDLLAAGLQKAVPDLAAFLKSQPASFWSKLPKSAAPEAAPENQFATDPSMPSAQPASAKETDDTSTLEKALEQMQKSDH